MSDTVESYLLSLSDDELNDAIEQAKADLEKAATDEPNSEWHESCFAGFVMLAMEQTRRNPTGLAHLN